MGFGHPVMRLIGGWVVCLALMVLGLPFGLRVAAGADSLRFLAEFLTDGSFTWMSARTHEPTRQLLTLPTGDRADLWQLRGRHALPGMILVHGLTPNGKDDPRLAWTAALLARAGFAVLVPDLPAMRAQRLRPDDASVVAAAIAQLTARSTTGSDRIVVVGISVGVAPAMGALAGPAVSAHVPLLVSLGGYAEARELIRYFTTGTYAFDRISGRVRADPELARTFFTANLDLVGPSDRPAVRAWLAGGPMPTTAEPETRALLAVLVNQDPAQADTLFAALPADTRALLDALSPARQVRRFPGRVLLVHGREDPAVPFTESLRLAAAGDPQRTRLVLVNLVGHVEGLTPAWQRAWDFARLWSATYEIFRG